MKHKRIKLPIGNNNYMKLQEGNEFVLNHNLLGIVGPGEKTMQSIPMKNKNGTSQGRVSRNRITQRIPREQRRRKTRRNRRR